MNVVVALEHRFDRTPDGCVWTRSAFAYPFWTRYLDFFDSVRVAARVRDVAGCPPDAKRADGQSVIFAAVPYYVGPWQYARRAFQVRRAARSVVRPEDAVILRVSSQIATCMLPLLERTGHPYGVEVVGDPYDVFAPGSVRHPLRRLLRWWAPRQLRHQCRGACAALYVTERALQRRYPPAPGAFTVPCSDVELPREAFALSPRIARGRQGRLRLVTVGALEYLYKGQDTLIDAVGMCTRDGLDLELEIIGDGKQRSMLEARASHLGDRVRFAGVLPGGQAVRDRLDAADVFVLPSRQEGLPRALAEAMARGLPCVASNVGGIPELLAPEDMVSPGDSTALAQKIREVIQYPDRREKMSARNLEKAQEYGHEILRERLSRFCRHLEYRTKEWLRLQDQRGLVPAPGSQNPGRQGIR
jgi:glycosyltransferase involved in cell wall biosynthesis